MKYTPVRMHIVNIMLAQPDGQWTVQQMTDLVAPQVHVPAGSVRETFLILMGNRLAEAVPFQKALTVRIWTDDKTVNALSTLRHRWRAEHEPAADYQSALSKGGDHV